MARDKSVVLWVIILFLTLTGAARGAERWNVSISPTLPPTPPNQSILRRAVGCYDIETFLPLNCSFTFNIEGVNLSGGHIHYGNRPIGGLRMLGNSGDGITNLSGQTGYQDKTVEYLVPQVSGEVKVYTSYTPPGRYVCVNPPDCRYEGTVSIEVAGLQPMPISGEGHWRPTGQTTIHQDNHYGTSSTKARIGIMARDYFEDTDTGVAIGVNDMSLEWGGLFDICGTWNPADVCSNAPKGGHHLHRIGKSVDIDSGVNEKKLNKIAIKYGCERKKSTGIHYECP